MDVACTECKSRFKISDEKVPEGAASSFTCPNCKSKVAIGPKKKPLTEAVDEVEYEIDYDASEKAFDFLGTGSRTALICEADKGLKNTIIHTIQSAGYQITDAPNAQTAIKKIWYHIYDVILLDENFDISKTGQNKVLSYLQGLNMTVRRQSSVVLITKSARTMDQMAAFKLSVNLLINIKDLKDLIRIVDHSISTLETVYRVYRGYLTKEATV